MKWNLYIGDEGPWLLDTEEMKNSDGEMCEQLTGWSAFEWMDALGDLRARAIKFAIWLARNRAGDPVEWADLDFPLLSVRVEAVPDEDESVEPPADLGVGEDDLAMVPTGPAETPQDGSD